MTTTGWQAAVLLVTAALALGGCRKPGPHAVGSGYGVGIARMSWTIGNGMRGASTQGVSAPTEANVGRVRSPLAAAETQAGHL
jgi:hypothetical protein